MESKNIVEMQEVIEATVYLGNDVYIFKATDGYEFTHVEYTDDGLTEIDYIRKVNGTKKEEGYISSRFCNLKYKV